MSSLVEYTAPAAEPVTSTEAKLFARIDTSDDDAIVTALITAARKMTETYTGRTWVHTVYDYYLDSAELEALGTAPIILPTCPLKASSTTIKYYDDDGTENTFAATSYTADVYSVPSRIYLLSGQAYPSAVRDYNGLKVTFTAGYSADATSVPEAAKTAIKIMVADMYEHREDEVIGTTLVKLSIGARAILDPLKVRRFW